MKKIYLSITFLVLIGLAGCDKNNNVNIFSVQDDIALGNQIRDEIASNPQQYNLMSRSQYPTAYGHLDRIANTLLNSGKVTYRDDFEWEFFLIRDDNTLNAFCTPGGKIYVYTGLIKYLDSEYELAGVMAHEIAHADRRHASRQMTKQYGVSILLDVALGADESTLAQITENLVNLSFSRADETEADEYSVVYMCPTEYDARGAKKFFEKLIEEGQTGNTPAFLSTHPNPENRVENIDAFWEENCNVEGEFFDARYAEFKSSLN